MTASPAAVAHRFAGLVDRRDWVGLEALLAEDCAVSFVHDGRVFTGTEWVAFNADYPGRWSFVAEDIVACDERAVVRARVFNDTATFHVASFLTVRDGLIHQIDEVWADGHAAPQED